MNNYEETGSLDKNLILKTKGQVYIRYGKKHFELLNNKGELNVKFPKIIKLVNSLDNLSDGFYVYDDELYYVINGSSNKINKDSEKESSNIFDDIGTPSSGDILYFNGEFWEYKNITEITDRISKLEQYLKNNDNQTKLTEI